MFPRGPSVWCDYCNAHITHSNVRACTRKTCQTKDKVPPLPAPRRRTAA